MTRKKATKVVSLDVMQDQATFRYLKETHGILLSEVAHECKMGIATVSGYLNGGKTTSETGLKIKAALLIIQKRLTY